jgi:hypothetical protein
MLCYKSLELRRNLSLLRFVFQLMRGSTTFPSLLECIGLNVATNFLRGRQHEYLAVPASRTNLYRVAPIPRAIPYINGIITDDPDFDIYRMKKEILCAIASSYQSKQFSSNDEEDWMQGLQVKRKRVLGRVHEHTLDFPLYSLRWYNCIIYITGHCGAFGPLSAALAQISVIKHPLKATITDLKFSPFGIDIGNFEIQLLDLED